MEARFHDWQLANFPIEVLNTWARNVHRANPPPVDVEPLAPRQLLVSSERVNPVRQPGESRVDRSVIPQILGGIAADPLERRTPEEGGIVRVANGMIEVEALVVQEPVAPRVEVVGIAEPLDRERQPPRQTDVVVVPRGDELAACQTNGGVLFVAYGWVPLGHVHHAHAGFVADQLLSGAVVEDDQFLVRIVLSQKGRDGLLEEVLVVRGTVIGGADAADQRQARLWPKACACGPAGDASIRAAARCHRRRWLGLGPFDGVGSPVANLST